MPKQRIDRTASLVVRAFVEAPARLLVRVVEVDPSGEDRLVGLSVSSAAASQIVRQWLDALVDGRASQGGDGGNAHSRGRVTTS